MCREVTVNEYVNAPGGTKHTIYEESDHEELITPPNSKSPMIIIL